MRLRLRAAVLVLAVSGAPAFAQEPPSLGLETPFLVGNILTDGRDSAIDLGDDGATDLLIYGSGLLHGTERIPAGSRGALQVIARDADGRWRHAQSFPNLPDRFADLTFAHGDVDGDGLEDIVTGIVSEQQDWNDPQTFGIDFLRQGPTGKLQRAGTALLDSIVQERSQIHILGDGSGRVLVASPLYTQGVGWGVWGTMLQWRAESGWTRTWAAAPDSVNHFDRDRGGAILLGDSSPLWVTYGHDVYSGRRWGSAIPIKPDGWGTPIVFDLPRNGWFHELERNGERQLWCWTEAEDDSLYQIIKPPGADSVFARAIPIEGLSQTINLTPIDAAVTPSGVAYFLATGGYNHAYLVELSPDGSARLQSHWTGPDAAPIRLVIAPEGTVEVLWGTYGALLLLPPEPHEIPPPSVPIRISQVDAQADFDGDGLTDIVVLGTVGGVTADWILRGIDGPPWFRTPEPVNSFPDDPRTSYSCAVGDLDGDGRRDMIQFFEDDWNDPHAAMMVCRFWDRWRFRHDSASDAALTNIAGWEVGDFDGDRRDEVIVIWRALDGEVKRTIYQWNRNGELESSREFRDPSFSYYDLWRAGDVDGDGRDELMGAREFSFALWRIDPDSAAATNLGSWARGRGFEGGGLADLSGDGCDDLYWFGQDESWVWSLESRDPYSFTRRQIPFEPLVSADFSAVDVDIDGRPDLLGDSDGGLVEMITTPLDSPRPSIGILPESLADLDLVRYFPTVWADVDRDGDPDLVTLCVDGIRVHRNETIRPADDGGASPMVRLAGRHPARDETRVAVHADCAGEISLELFDVAGRRVWSERRPAWTEGWLDVPIRPRVGRAAVPAGVYFLRVEVSGRVETQRIVLGF